MERAHPDHTMISSDRVKDTPVYSTAGDHIGDIDHLMIDKVSGQVRYAVMSFGGLMGLAQSHYPIPWNALAYDTGLNGYVTEITESQLRDAPEFSDDSYNDREWEERLHKHYDMAPYYGL